MNLLIFGFGFTGKALARRLLAKGWRVAATVRKPEDAAAARALGVQPVDPADAPALSAAGSAQAILVTAPPTDRGCPGLAALTPAIATAGAFPDWIGYLSTTGVYGDRAGGWVTEDSALAAQSIEGARRAAAERDWRQIGRGMGLTITAFRLPGIYGPGRSPFERLRDGTARRLVKPGHVFSRIHVDDLAAGLEASIARPRAAGVYNQCDDEPAPAEAVKAAARGGLRPGHPVAVSLALLCRVQARLQRPGQGGAGLAARLSDLPRGPVGGAAGGRPTVIRLTSTTAMLRRRAPRS
jgi:nucleoside-diphosphate-sugar epimerase